jgi:hypothetical protein
MFIEPDLAIVRIEEHSYNISRIEVSMLVVLLQLQPTNVKASYEEGTARLTPSFFEVV